MITVGPSWDRSCTKPRSPSDARGLPKAKVMLGDLLKALESHGFHEDPTKVAAKTEDQWNSVRAQQSDLLYKSDWTCSVVDPPAPILAQRDQWIAYRAALRAVTLQSDPFNIVWPSPPVAN